MSEIRTQGRDDKDEWVTSYTVTYTAANLSVAQWLTVRNASGHIITFAANTDRYVTVANQMPDDVNARHVRLSPVTWHNSVSMRFAVFGCNYIGKQQIRNLLLSTDLYFRPNVIATQAFYKALRTPPYESYRG